MTRLLIVDDEAPQMRALCDTLSQEGFVTTGFTSATEALAALRPGAFDLLVTDLMMPDMDGIQLLNAACAIDAQIVGIVMTGHAAIDTAVAAMKAGALDYISKPFRLNVMLPVLIVRSPYATCALPTRSSSSASASARTSSKSPIATLKLQIGTWKHFRSRSLMICARRCTSSADFSTYT